MRSTLRDPTQGEHAGATTKDQNRLIKRHALFTETLTKMSENIAWLTRVKKKIVWTPQNS